MGGGPWSSSGGSEGSLDARHQISVFVDLAVGAADGVLVLHQQIAQRRHQLLMAVAGADDEGGVGLVAGNGAVPASRGDQGGVAIIPVEGHDLVSDKDAVGDVPRR